MAGHMGDKNTTVQNLEIEKIDLEDNVLLVKGAVPGSIGSFLKITPSIKGDEKLSLEAPVDEAPVEDVSAKGAAIDETEVEKAPVEEAAVEETVEEEAKTEDVKSEETKDEKEEGKE